MSEEILKNIPLGEIRENKDALRAVEKKTEKYAELVDSVREKGILNPIVVRPMTDPETGEEFYGLVDGLHRYTAATDAELASIPAHVKAMDDEEVLEAQIIGNIHRVETRPVEYSKQLHRLLAHRPTMTQTELAKSLGKSVTWIAERLQLTSLDEKIQKMVDDGSINLSNAYSLAKLPSEEQESFLEAAMSDSPQDFAPKVLARRKEINKAKREGRDATNEFVAPTKLRKIGEMKQELEKPTAFSKLSKTVKVSTPEEGFNLAVQWALHQDEVSVQHAKEADDARKAEAAEKRERAKMLKNERKAHEAQIKSERLILENKLMQAGKTPEEIKSELQNFDDAMEIQQLEEKMKAEGAEAGDIKTAVEELKAEQTKRNQETVSA